MYCSEPEELIQDNIQIHFNHIANENPIIFNSLINTTSSGQNYSVINLFYIISDISLTDEEGNVLENIAETHFVTSSDTNSYKLFIPEKITKGNYANIEFVFGLNSIKNISNQFLNDNFHLQMFWPEFMGGGYHYMKLEGKYNNDSNFYATHTGGLNGTDYSIRKSFPLNLNSCENGKTHNIQITMDINNWYNNPNEIIITSDGIMNNELLQQQLMENGFEDVFKVSLINVEE